MNYKFFKVNPSVLDPIFGVAADSTWDTDQLLVNSYIVALFLYTDVSPTICSCIKSWVSPVTESLLSGWFGLVMKKVMLTTTLVLF